MKTLNTMGVNLVRLYDWEPRNYHLRFLDYCDTLGIKVLVPVSNYFVRPDQGLPNKNILIPELIKSYSNAGQTDYHPAVAGIIIGNEPELNNFTAQNCIDFTTTWVNIEQSQFGGHREVQIGHPVDFGLYGGQYPCWGFWNPLLAALNAVTTRNLSQRLFLAPQTYNDRGYLFENAESSGKGYVELTYEQYQKPILFTEIGHDRTKNLIIRTPWMASSQDVLRTTHSSPVDSVVCASSSLPIRCGFREPRKAHSALFLMGTPRYAHNLWP